MSEMKEEIKELWQSWGILISYILISYIISIPIVMVVQSVFHFMMWGNIENIPFKFVFLFPENVIEKFYFVLLSAFVTPLIYFLMMCVLESKKKVKSG